MKEKIYTHRGVPIMVFMLLMYMGFMTPFVIVRANYLFYIILFSTALLFFGLLCVYNITITIDERYLSFKLGIGLIKKRYEIEDIISCKPYSGISKRMGVGFKMSFGGILEYYIVTGTKAIELNFRNKKATVLIGTKQPEEISRYVQSLIDRNTKLQFDIEPDSLNPKFLYRDFSRIID